MSELLVNQCNLVVIGAWNPAIIQPSWLKKEFPHIIKEDTATIQAVLGSSAPLQFEIEKKVIIASSHSNLTFTPQKVDDETLDFISKLSSGIQEKLPHTPITAAGCNFVFKLGENEYFKIDDLEKNDTLNEFYNNLSLPELTSKNVHHTLAFEDYCLNIRYSYNGRNKIIQYNYDYRQSLPMKKAADSLQKNYDKSTELNSKLIGEK